MSVNELVVPELHDFLWIWNYRSDVVLSKIQGAALIAALVSSDGDGCRELF